MNTDVTDSSIRVYPCKSVAEKFPEPPLLLPCISN